MVSVAFHMFLLLLLMWLTRPTKPQPPPRSSLVLGNSEAVEQIDLAPSLSLPLQPGMSSTPADAADAIASEVPLELNLPQATEPNVAAVPVQYNPLSRFSRATTDQWSAPTSAAANNELLDNRSGASRADALAAAGGNAGSEAAVQGALQWLVNHQFPDGGWSLNHKSHPNCNGQCPDIGQRENCRFGATGLALLPLLGAGQTHRKGEYSQAIDDGIRFLIKRIDYQGERGRLVDQGNYYSHALCTIAICEAYAMSHDKKLQKPAQALINEIVFAQDPVGGGWRYHTKSPGDISVTGWQLMALNSATMAYLKVPPTAIAAAVRFLESVECDGGQERAGGHFRYLPDRQPTRSATAIGLLCRMYTGWKSDHPPLIAGMATLKDLGPDIGQVENGADDGPDVGGRPRNDVYYNYYATQVFRQIGGPDWVTWNQQLRDYLIDTQEHEGHASGSWYFHEDGMNEASEAGGRLYCTSMCAMILEVYYRHLPLYQNRATVDLFPL